MVSEACLSSILGEPRSETENESFIDFKLGDQVVKVGSGVTPTGGSRVYKKHGRKFLRSQNVGWGTLDLSDIAYIDEETHKSFAGTEIREGDVLLNITGASIGRCAIADSLIAGGNVNQHVCIIRTSTDNLDPGYLKYFLLSTSGQRQIDSFQAGGNREGLNFGQIRSFIVRAPLRVQKQRAIALALSDVDSLIQSLDGLIAKKRDLKQGAMQLLLAGKKRLPGFSGAWQTTSLGVLCKSISDGTHFTPRYVDSGIPFYSVENVTQGNFSNTKYITAQEHELLIRRCKPERGDILLTRIGSLGDTKLIDWDVNASIYVSLALLKLKSDVCPEYIYAYTKSRRFVTDIERRSLLNAAPKKINMNEIEKVTILIPPTRDEQEKIGNMLLEMARELEALEAKLRKTRLLKQGMMQSLLTGQRRLV